MENFKFLVLAGGRSTRMGSPKHLLPFTDGKPLYSRLAQVLRAASPKLSTLYISLTGYSVLDDALQRGDVATGTKQDSARLQLCRIYDETKREIGPAAGLIAAHHRDPSATWLAVACDFPFLSVETVRQLIDEYEAPITCFVNADGFSEPFLAAWSPEALRTLEQNVAHGNLSSSRTIQELAGKRIAPRCESSIKNVNTREEWESFMACM